MSVPLLNENDVIDSRYEIIHFHKEGGMQQVYRANDLKLNKIVALKIPKQNSAEKRFAKSAVASARINHPFVAKALDYIPSEPADIFIEEFIDGHSLHEYLEDYFFYFDPHLATKFAQQIASGLAASHHAKVIHRDIKPANIMVTDSGGSLDFKITDFGISKLAEEEFNSVTSKPDPTTHSSTFLGALPYMAPEVIRSTKNASFASDVWAFGALLYHVIFGKYPFGYGPQAAVNIASGEIPPLDPPFPSKKQFTSLTGQLARVIEQCFQLKVSDRPSADDLVKELCSLCFCNVPYRVDIAGASGTYGKWRHTRQNFFIHPASFLGKASEFCEDAVLYFGVHGEFNRAHPVVPLKQKLPSSQAI